MRGLRQGFARDTWWSRLLFAGLILFSMLIYLLTNRLAGPDGAGRIWQFPVDARIPFLPVFILPYCYWYLQVLVSAVWLVFAARTDRLLHRMVLAMTLAMVLSCLVFLLFPTRIVRPEVPGDDLCSRIVRLLYATDRPANLFPSTHVAWAVIMSRAWHIAGPRRLWFRIFNGGGLILICLSTVLIKQHYTPDILGGTAVALISWPLAGRIVHRVFPTD